MSIYENENNNNNNKNCFANLFSIKVVVFFTLVLFQKIITKK